MTVDTTGRRLWAAYGVIDGRFCARSVRSSMCISLFLRLMNDFWPAPVSQSTAASINALTHVSNSGSGNSAS
jgi:hypothetical protein